MKKGTKTIVTMVVLVGVLGGAAVAYQNLGKQVRPEQQLVPATEQKGGTEPGGETVPVRVSESVPGQGSESDPEGESTQGAVTGQRKEKMAPDFTVIDQDGNSVTLSDLYGKPIVLNFWASWCPPCKGEMPEFEAVYQELGSEVQFMMVDVTDGQRETVENATAFITEQGYSFPVYFDTQFEASYGYNVQSIPKTYFIDKEGYLVVGAQGAIDEETLRRGIEMIR